MTSTSEQSNGEQGARNLRRTLKGEVVSTACDKTITVRVNRTSKHPKYGKYVRSAKKYMAHDETNQAQMGDLVRIEGTRPYSKQKRWRLAEVLGSSSLAGAPTINEISQSDVVTEEVVAEDAGSGAGEAGAE